VKLDEQICAELRSAAAGILVMSESDYPLEILNWDGKTSITPEYLCHICGKPDGSTVQETDLDTFFGAKGKFRKVVTAIKDNLADVKVYKVGEIDIPVFIVGRSQEGNWLGLSTRLIQT
jgi:hypothetical protein